MTLKDQLDAWRLRVDAALLQQLPEQDSNGTQLQAAMRYAATIGGKRVRPVLTYATGEALGVDPARLDVPAMAVEMMHAYSLVHDDLPAMDDDDLRRGNPTCHIRFGEATAILAGDALQALAFTLLATNKDPKLSDTARVRMIAILGEASGGLGMAAGQAIDLEAVGKSLDLAALENMHRHKTGALIRASVVMGAMTAGAEPDLIKRLDSYAAAVGLSFQIVDDILDVVSDLPGWWSAATELNRRKPFLSWPARRGTRVPPGTSGMSPSPCHIRLVRPPAPTHNRHSSNTPLTWTSPRLPPPCWTPSRIPPTSNGWRSVSCRSWLTNCGSPWCIR